MQIFKRITDEKSVVISATYIKLLRIRWTILPRAGSCRLSWVWRLLKQGQLIRPASEYPSRKLDVGGPDQSIRTGEDPNDSAGPPAPTGGILPVV
ncbi:hypothetical protein OUZ56_012320 [Daphnia magna]|uniref:Uncharacterized protein n=1 Tax=Daphnia magna TaxID=35525 RepID=A0ABQ9Z2T5_9CRUS|nr:hypothetical protein OUZ56_012320 [Daphnia magna]